MKRISLKIRDSNWETVTFLIIYNFLKSTGKNFSRSELMRTENIDRAIKWLRHLNHKKHPRNPEETLQRTLQNLRDKGFIIFHGQGEYELTEIGIEECKRVANELNIQTSKIDETIEAIKKEYDAENLEKAEEIIKSLTPDEIRNVLKELELDENSKN